MLWVGVPADKPPPNIVDRHSVITLSNLAKLVPTDKADAGDALASAGVLPTMGARNAHHYPLFTGAEVLMERKEGLGKKASELNQEAQAKLNDVKRKQLERELVPIAEVRQVIAEFASMTSEALDGSELPMDIQNDIVVRLQESARKAFGEAEE